MPTPTDDDLDFTLGLDAEFVIPAELRHLDERYRAPVTCRIADPEMARKVRWHGFTKQKQAAAALVRGGR